MLLHGCCAVPDIDINLSSLVCSLVASTEVRWGSRISFFRVNYLHMHHTAKHDCQTSLPSYGKILRRVAKQPLVTQLTS